MKTLVSLIMFPCILWNLLRKMMREKASLAWKTHPRISNKKLKKVQLNFWLHSRNRHAQIVLLVDPAVHEYTKKSSKASKQTSESTSEWNISWNCILRVLKTESKNSSDKQNKKRRKLQLTMEVMCLKTVMKMWKTCQEYYNLRLKTSKLPTTKNLKAFILKLKAKSKRWIKFMKWWLWKRIKLEIWLGRILKKKSKLLWKILKY